jgi:hypothetical protein
MNNTLNLIIGDVNSYIQYLVGTDRAAFSEGYIWLGGTICDVRAPHTRTPI